jgi:hypothetical protein
VFKAMFQGLKDFVRPEVLAKNGPSWRSNRVATAS